MFELFRMLTGDETPTEGKTLIGTSRWSGLSVSVGWIVGRSVIISWKGGKFHFHAPIGVLFYSIEKIVQPLFHSFINPWHFPSTGCSSKQTHPSRPYNASSNLQSLLSNRSVKFVSFSCEKYEHSEQPG